MKLLKEVLKYALIFPIAILGLIFYPWIAAFEQKKEKKDSK